MTKVQVNFYPMPTICGRDGRFYLLMYVVVFLIFVTKLHLRDRYCSKYCLWAFLNSTRHIHGHHATYSGGARNEMEETHKKAYLPVLLLFQLQQLQTQ